jgi:hypothetical protein
MIRLIAVAAFTLAIATSAHAMTLAPLHQSDGMITQVRHACGAGMHMVNGHCVKLLSIFPAITSQRGGDTRPEHGQIEGT